MISINTPGGLQEVFQYNSQQVRTVMVENEPWFVAKDVCEILEIKNTTDVVKRLDIDEVTRLNLGGLVGETNVVNEAGLYSLILGSRKPEAKEFKRWITHEVLPSIRQSGQYSLVPTAVQIYLEMSEEDKAIAYFTAQKGMKQLPVY